MKAHDRFNTFVNINEIQYLYTTDHNDMSKFDINVGLKYNNVLVLVYDDKKRRDSDLCLLERACNQE